MKIVWVVDDDEEMIHARWLMLKLLDCETWHYFLGAPGGPDSARWEAP